MRSAPKQIFADIVQQEYSQYIDIYTDGSKSPTGMEAAAVHRQMTSSASLPRIASILTVALYAIHLAINIIREIQAS